MTETMIEPKDALTPDVASAYGPLSAAIEAARRYPRDIRLALQQIESAATVDPETAGQCYYAFRRGDKVITGPSVRLAELAARSWANLLIRAQIIDIDRSLTSPRVRIEVTAADLETNRWLQVQKTRRILCKRAATAPDEDDVQLAAAAAISIGVRDAIFWLVPKVWIQPIVARCIALAAGRESRTPLEVRRQRVIERFGELGVSADRVCRAVGVASPQQIGEEQLGTLIGIGTAIRDGELTIEEAFGPPAPAQPAEPQPQAAASQPDGTPEPRASESRSRRARTRPNTEPPLISLE